MSSLSSCVKNSPSLINVVSIALQVLCKAPMIMYSPFKLIGGVVDISAAESGAGWHAKKSAVPAAARRADKPRFFTRRSGGVGFDTAGIVAVDDAELFFRIEHVSHRTAPRGQKDSVRGLDRVDAVGQQVAAAAEDRA